MALKTTLGIITICALCLLLTPDCARYPSMPELKEGVPVETQKTGEDAQLEARMRDLLLNLKRSEPGDYVIGVKDVLEIEVWQQPEMTQKVTVSQDGTITLPLIGAVKADGKSVSALQQEITERLSGRFLINPQVTVRVEQFNSKSVYLLGQVGGQGGKGVGRYPLRYRTTLLEILTEAGLSDEAGTQCIVVRPVNNRQKDHPTLPDDPNAREVITIDLTDLMKGDLLQNIELQDGDTVYVPKAQHYYVFGQVKNPGKFKYEKDTTVLKAITTAGSLTEKAASMKHVKILREEGGKRVKISVKPTDLVKPEDTIIVPESLF